MQRSLKMIRAPQKCNYIPIQPECNRGYVAWILSLPLALILIAAQPGLSPVCAR